jgi:3-deoxy-D-manno-oct-2-ulosonic acid (Kdo) hydroxylase
MIETFNLSSWDTDCSPDIIKRAINSLEEGKVLFFPHLSFQLLDGEFDFLSHQLVHPGTKNISFSQKTGLVKGSLCKEDKITCLKQMMHRYAQSTFQLMEKLFISYHQNLEVARTSFRPVEIEGRVASYRKDDTLLHVDAFPSTPTQGRRILRIFSNVNQEGKARIWRLGSPFENVVKYFVPKIKKPLRGVNLLLEALKITRGRRTLYDHYMLQLHNAMKFDMDYQKNVPQIQFHFPPGSTWIAYTDQVSHAAIMGNGAVEQTFYVPRRTMHNFQTAPQTVLENFLGKKLT